MHARVVAARAAGGCVTAGVPPLCTVTVGGRPGARYRGGMALADKPALLVIDMQNDFVMDDGFFVQQRAAPYSAEQKQLLLQSCRTLIDAAHAAGAPVIYAQVHLRPDKLDSALSVHRDAALFGKPYLVPGTWGAEIVPELTPAPDDLIVTKKGNSAFQFTHLDRMLRNMGVDSLVMVGGAVYGCVNATLRDAAMLGYPSYVVTEAMYPVGDPTCSYLGNQGALSSVAQAAEVLGHAQGKSYAYRPDADWRAKLQHSCLLMIDLQHEYVSKGGVLSGPPETFDAPAYATMLDTNVTLMEWARAEQLPVITVRLVNRPDAADSAVARVMLDRLGVRPNPAACVAGTWGAEFEESVAPRPELGDIEVMKPGNGAFAYTPLHRILTNLGVTQCLVTGGAIGGCVEETIRQGSHLGYSMVVIGDACYRPGEPRLQLLTNNAALISSRELLPAAVPALA